MKKKLLFFLFRFFLLIFFCVFNSVLFAQKNDKFFDESEVYSFELPAGVFSKKNENYYYSKSLSASIKFHSASDYAGEEDFNADIKNQFRIAKKGLKVIYQTLKDDKFTVSGYDNRGNIVYVKGDSQILKVRNNPDNQDELNWLWTKTMIVTFTYPISSKTSMDKIISMFLKTYDINLFLL